MHARWPANEPANERKIGLMTEVAANVDQLAIDTLRILAADLAQLYGHQAVMRRASWTARTAA